MNNFNKLVDDKIQIHNLATSQELRAQYRADLDDVIDQLIEDKADELYYKFFVDRALTKIIDKQLKNVTCVEDMLKPFEVSISFDVRYFENETFDLCKSKMRHFRFVKGMRVIAPPIGDALDYYPIDTEKASLSVEMKIIRNLLPRIAILNILPYTNECNLQEKEVSNIFEDYTYEVLSFTCTLKELINMYYMEKQRQEYEIYNESESKIKTYNNNK